MGKICYQFVSFFLLYLVTLAQCRGIVSHRSSTDKKIEGNCLNKKVSLITQSGSKESDKIYKLPGQPKDMKLKQYSGYITVDANAGRALFYYFVESTTNHVNKPLVLWLNGGPGCSSLGYGVFEEIGPFRVNKDGKTLYRNEFTWITEANILFLESPVGTGFSYSNTTSDDDNNGDSRTAHDSYIFLLNWLERFPEYKSKDFYITGESYSGHFIPQLAQTIINNNNCGDQTKINLQDILIVNGLIDFETRTLGRLDYLWSHALISDEIRNSVQTNCDFSSPETMSDVCNNLHNQALNVTGNILPDEIYAPLCNSSSRAPDDTAYDPCTDNYVTAYLNSPQVQVALHANVTKISYPWILCSSRLLNEWKDQALSTLPVIQELMKDGVTVWLLSGDVDSLIPVTATRYAINKLKPREQVSWYAWYSGGEVGGYAVGYENLTFVTVRGAGHEAPSYQPARCFGVFASFINGKLPPANTYVV